MPEPCGSAADCVLRHAPRRSLPADLRRHGEHTALPIPGSASTAPSTLHPTEPVSSSLNPPLHQNAGANIPTFAVDPLLLPLLLLFSVLQPGDPNASIVKGFRCLRVLRLLSKLSHVGDKGGKENPLNGALQALAASIPSILCLVSSFTAASKLVPVRSFLGPHCSELDFTLVTWPW